MRARLAALLIPFSSLVWAGAARAACDGETPRNAVAVYPLSFATRAVGAEYERFVLPPRLSVAGGLSVRGASLADYHSTDLDADIEARFWIWPKSPLGCDGDMEGPYVGFRFDGVYTWLDDRREDRFLGSAITLRETLLAGYRFAFWRRVYIAPFGGVEASHDFDPRGVLAPVTRYALTGGFGVGWLF